MLRLEQITFACEDPKLMAEFWAEFLDGYTAEGAGESWRAVGDGTTLSFSRMQKSPTIELPIHLDVNVPDREAELQRLEPSLTIVNSLAQYEVHVARYYYSRGAYVAAINRAQNALTDYQEVPAGEEALFILVRSYDALGMTQLRDDARRVMEKSYPKSEYLSSGFKSRQDP